MSDTFTYQPVVTTAGAQPTPPATLLAFLLSSVSAVTPGYTATLPSSLIEDISSTDVGALVMIDTAVVELFNSMTPLGSNAFILSQLGQIYLGPGSAPAPPTNTSVNVVFEAVDVSSNPIAGQVIPVGFTVSDGTYQYIVQDGGVTSASGFTPPLFCQASIPGTWPVPTNSVTQIITPPPTGVTLTCTNQIAGVSGSAAETEEQYRARVLQAGQAVCQGAQSTLKTLLGQVPGVQQRLISVLQQTGGGWEIIVGGGDIYQVAFAIYQGVSDISTLVGSQLLVTNITQAANGVVTTNLNHGYVTGQVCNIAQVVGMTPINSDGPYTITVTDEKHFELNISTSGFPPYVSGGIVTPNLRNQTPNILDFPDVYTVPFVTPPQQTVTMTVGYVTTANNFVALASIAQLAAPALAAYVNSITVGAPMNLLVMEETFLTSVASVLPASQFSSLTFTVSINGVSTPPLVGTQLIVGDPESYFQTTTAQITVTEV